MAKSWTDKLNEILDGWKHVIWKTDEVEKIAKERAKICAKCPSMYGTICSECGCPIHAKTRSMVETNKCPLDKW